MEQLPTDEDFSIRCLWCARSQGRCLYLIDATFSLTSPPSWSEHRGCCLTVRVCAVVVGVLPGSSKIIVAGGTRCNNPGEMVWPPPFLVTAEVWDPVTDQWSDIAPLSQVRIGAVACVLPVSGRFAVPFILIDGYFD